MRQRRFFIVLLIVIGYVLRVRNVCGKIEVLADSEKWKQTSAEISDNQNCTNLVQKILS